MSGKEPRGLDRNLGEQLTRPQAGNPRASDLTDASRACSAVDESIRSCVCGDGDSSEPDERKHKVRPDRRPDEQGRALRL